MRSDDELLAFKRGGESGTVEFKPSDAQGSAIRRAICAFANDLMEQGGGMVFIGLNNDGTCAGVKDADRTQRNLANWARGGDILPLPDVEIARRFVDDCQVIVAEVRPSATPPVRYQGQIWVRIGTTNHRATAEQERRLVERRRGHERAFDLRPAEGMTLEDLDLDYFERVYLPNAVAPEILEENRRDTRQQLHSLRLLASDRSTNGAVLILGRQPQSHIPGAYVQFLRIDGTELGDPVKDEKKLTGSLPHIVNRLDELFENHIKTMVDIEAGATEKQHPDYPVIALRQLARNALIHRSYEGTHAPVRIYWFNDRVEMSNPGGLYGQVTRENFGQGITDYRNPLVAEAMHVLGYVQRFGYGVPLARRHLRENGNPEPEFQFEPTYVGVKVRAAA